MIWYACKNFTTPLSLPTHISFAENLIFYFQVFIIGGVGPLHSDVTVAGVAKAFGVRLVSNTDALNYFCYTEVTLL